MLTTFAGFSCNISATELNVKYIISAAVTLLFVAAFVHVASKASDKVRPLYVIVGTVFIPAMYFLVSIFIVPLGCQTIPFIN